ncbi:MAG: hypothetical protein WCG25_05465 [bacterium]
MCILLSKTLAAQIWKSSNNSFLLIGYQCILDIYHLVHLSLSICIFTMLVYSQPFSFQTVQSKQAKRNILFDGDHLSMCHNHLSNTSFSIVSMRSSFINFDHLAFWDLLICFLYSKLIDLGDHHLCTNFHFFQFGFGKSILFHSLTTFIVDSQS